MSVVNSIVVVVALNRCALLPSVWDLKAAQMNVVHNLIQEIMHYDFEVSSTATDATKKNVRN